MDARDKIAIDYGNLADGERKSGQLCPQCNGGSRGETSFAVSRHRGQLRYICFRASCGFTGRVSLTSSGSVAVQQSGEPKPQRPVITEPLPAALAEELEAKYNIEVGVLELAKWVYTRDYKGFGPRVGMPILAPDRSVRGYSWRSYTGVIPKALISKNTQEEMICWYRGRKYGKVLVVTEDQPSALRIAAQGLDAVALCGTLLTLNRIYEIKGQNYDRVYLCLDEDAFGQAIKHAVAYKARLPQLIIKKLDEDVKNMSPDNFEMFIQSVSLP